MCLHTNFLHNPDCFPGSKLPLSQPGLSAGPACSCFSALCTRDSFPRKLVYLCSAVSSVFPLQRLSPLSCESKLVELALTWRSINCPVPSIVQPGICLCHLSFPAFHPSLCSHLDHKLPYCFSLPYSYC